MNKKRRNSKLTIDLILLSKETTKFRSDAQCLEEANDMLIGIHSTRFPIRRGEVFVVTDRVTLNIRNRRRERNTETPNDSSGLKCVQITSKMEPIIT